MNAAGVEAVLAAIGVTPATRSGGRAWCLCPDHQQPTDPPAWATAFFVRLRGRRRAKDGRTYDAAGQFHCFVCGAGGSLVDLVRKVRGLSQDDAEKFVRARGGTGDDRPRAAIRVVDRPPQLGRPRYHLPREIIFEPLRDWVSGAQDYARGRCGITDDEVELFGMGYAVDGKLAGRIVLPWRGAGGRPGGYSARAAFPDDLDPKYMTPHQSDGADLAVMFGEHLWPYPVRRRRATVVVTEGALNALAARRARPDLAVAALGGSEPNDGQALKLAGFGRVAVLTDPDPAGDKAARLLGARLARWTTVARVPLPRGCDPLDMCSVDRVYVGPEPLRRVLQCLP